VRRGAHFRDVEFVIPFRVKIHRSSTDAFPRLPKVNGWEYTTSLNPQMASPRFPFSHVPSEIPLSRTGTEVTHLQWRLPTSNVTQRALRTWRIPEWLAASGLTIGKQSTSFQHCSSMSQKDSSRLQRKSDPTRAPPHQGQSPSS
jgi:hypothetical protein